MSGDGEHYLSSFCMFAGHQAPRVHNTGNPSNQHTSGKSSPVFFWQDYCFRVNLALLNHNS